MKLTLGLLRISIGGDSKCCPYSRKIVWTAAFSLFVIFALLAIRLFGNKLYFCNDRSILTGRQDCFGTFVDPVSGIFMPRVWDRPEYNFDSLGKVSRAYLKP